MYYFCTYFDKNYLDKGLALYNSLVKHCQPFKLWILCLDNETYHHLAEKQLPHTNLIPISWLEESDRKLNAAKDNRSLIEYYFTCTPILIQYVMNLNKEVDVLTYLDADLYFYDSIEPAYQELRKGSVLIVPHRFPDSLKHLEKYGIYNVGLVSFRRDNNGFSCLKWWREKCLEWCYDRLEDGKFADQKYLDDWPIRFTGVIVLQNKSIGIAPWNLKDYDRLPMIMYHFHGLKRVTETIWDLGLLGYHVRMTPLVKEYYLQYMKELNSFGIIKTSSIRKRYSPLALLRKCIAGDLILFKEGV